MKDDSTYVEEQAKQEFALAFEIRETIEADKKIRAEKRQLVKDSNNDPDFEWID
jgi:hypothetical protein